MPGPMAGEPTSRPRAGEGERAALVIAHPGHELRVHGWLEQARPEVFVLTDGSGHTGRSRLASTSRLLARAGARPGCIYARLTDRDLYATLLDGQLDVFVRLAVELGEALAHSEVHVLQAGNGRPGGNMGLIAAGTGLGDSRTPMLVGLAGNLFNAALAYSLIYGRFGLPAATSSRPRSSTSSASSSRSGVTSCVKGTRPQPLTAI